MQKKRAPNHHHFGVQSPQKQRKSVADDSIAISYLTTHRVK